MRPTHFVIALFATTISLGGMAAAEPPPAGARSARKKQIVERVQTLRVKMVTEALGLDKPTAKKLAAVIDRFDEATQKLAAEALEVRVKLKAAVHGSPPDDREINAQLDRLVALRQQRSELNQRRFAAVREVLTPAQAARLVGLLPRIDARIREQLGKAAPAAREADEVSKP